MLKNKLLVTAIIANFLLQPLMPVLAQTEKKPAKAEATPEQKIEQLKQQQKYLGENCFEYEGKLTKMVKAGDGYDLADSAGNLIEDPVAALKSGKLKVRDVAINYPEGIRSGEAAVNCQQEVVRFASGAAEVSHQIKASENSAAPKVCVNCGLNSDVVGAVDGESSADQFVTQLQNKTVHSVPGVDANHVACPVPGKKEPEVKTKVNFGQKLGYCSASIGASLVWEATGVGTLVKTVQGQSTCVSEFLRGVWKDFWSNIHGVVDLAKMALKGAKAAGHWVADKWAALWGVEDKSTTGQFTAGNQIAAAVKDFKKDPSGHMNKWKDDLLKWVGEKIQNNFACEQWSGTPHWSTCTQPFSGMACMSCDSLKNTMCGVLGILGGEVAVAVATGGVFKAAKVGVTQAKMLASKLGPVDTFLAKSLGPIYKVPRAIVKAPVQGARALGKGAGILARGISNATKSKWAAMSSRTGFKAIAEAGKNAARYTGNKVMTAKTVVRKGIDAVGNNVAGKVVVAPFKGVHSLSKDYLRLLQAGFELDFQTMGHVRQVRLMEKAEGAVNKTVTLANRANMLREAGENSALTERRLNFATEGTWRRPAAEQNNFVSALSRHDDITNVERATLEGMLNNHPQGVAWTAEEQKVINEMVAQPRPKIHRMGVADNNGFVTRQVRSAEFLKAKPAEQTKLLEGMLNHPTLTAEERVLITDLIEARTKTPGVALTETQTNDIRSLLEKERTTEYNAYLQQTAEAYRRQKLPTLFRLSDHPAVAGEDQKFIDDLIRARNDKVDLPLTAAEQARVKALEAKAAQVDFVDPVARWSHFEQVYKEKGVHVAEVPGTPGAFRVVRPSEMGTEIQKIGETAGVKTNVSRAGQIEVTVPKGLSQAEKVAAQEAVARMKDEARAYGLNIVEHRRGGFTAKPPVQGPAYEAELQALRTNAADPKVGYEVGDDLVFKPKAGSTASHPYEAGQGYDAASIEVRYPEGNEEVIKEAMANGQRDGLVMNYNKDTKVLEVKLGPCK